MPNLLAIDQSLIGQVSEATVATSWPKKNEVLRVSEATVPTSWPKKNEVLRVSEATVA